MEQIIQCLNHVDTILKGNEGLLVGFEYEGERYQISVDAERISLQKINLDKYEPDELAYKELIH